MSTIPPGSRIGPYEVIEKIATGGMGAVYRAQHRAMQRDVALKVLLPGLAEDTEFIQRLHREAKAIAALRHPHIVEIHDANVDVEPYYLAMEFLPGGSLQGQLNRARQQGARLSIKEALAVTRQVASALDYAHTKGFVHRDIKPSNVLIAADGRYVLTDFGIAASSQGTKLTKTSVSMGTPEYMSPEQAQGRPLDRRSDLYSLGIMLYEMLAGNVPFSADTPVGVAFKHVRDTASPITKSRPEVPSTVKAILDRLLAKKPEARYQSASELIAAIDRQTQTVPLKQSSVPLIFAGLGLIGLVAAGFIAVNLIAGGDAQSTLVPAAPTADLSRAAVAQQPATVTSVAATATLVPAPTSVTVETTVPPTPVPPTPVPPTPVPAASATAETNTPVPTVVAVATTEIPPTKTLLPLREASPTPIAQQPPKPIATPTPAAEAPPPATQPAADAASGSPKPGQLFAFEQMPKCRRGDEPHGEIALSNDANTVHDGRASLHLSYAFPAVAKNYVVFKCPLAMRGQVTGMSAWVYGDGAGHFLNVWIKDAAGEIRQYTFGQIRHVGWRQMFAAFDERRGWPNSHITGANNGQLDYPVSFDAFLLDGVPDGRASTGSIYLDEVFAFSGALPAPAATTAPIEPPVDGDATAEVGAGESVNPPAVTSGDSLRIDVNGNRGSYRQWGKQVQPNSCNTDDKLGATLRFDLVIVLTNTGDRDMNDLRAGFVALDGTPMVACGQMPTVPVGATATTPLNTFAEVPVKQLVVTTADGRVVGRVCFARPAAGGNPDVVVVPC